MSLRIYKDEMWRIVSAAAPEYWSYENIDPSDGSTKDDNPVTAHGGTNTFQTWSSSDHISDTITGAEFDQTGSRSLWIVTDANKVIEWAWTTTNFGNLFSRQWFSLPAGSPAGIGVSTDGSSKTLYVGDSSTDSVWTIDAWAATGDGISPIEPASTYLQGTIDYSSLISVDDLTVDKNNRIWALSQEGGSGPDYLAILDTDNPALLGKYAISRTDGANRPEAHCITADDDGIWVWVRDPVTGDAWFQKYSLSGSLTTENTDTSGNTTVNALAYERPHDYETSSCEGVLTTAFAYDSNYYSLGQLWNTKPDGTSKLLHLPTGVEVNGNATDVIESGRSGKPFIATFGSDPEVGNSAGVLWVTNVCPPRSPSDWYRPTFPDGNNSNLERGSTSNAQLASDGSTLVMLATPWLSAITERYVYTSTDAGQTWTVEDAPNLFHDSGFYPDGLPPTDIKYDHGRWYWYHTYGTDPWEFEWSTDLTSWTSVTVSGLSAYYNGQHELVYCGDDVWVLCGYFDDALLESTDNGASWSVIQDTSIGMDNISGVYAGNGSGTAYGWGFDSGGAALIARDEAGTWSKTVTESNTPYPWRDFGVPYTDGGPYSYTRESAGHWTRSGRETHYLAHDTSWLLASTDEFDSIPEAITLGTAFYDAGWLSASSYLWDICSGLTGTAPFLRVNQHDGDSPRLTRPGVQSRSQQTNPRRISGRHKNTYY